jgi:membrane-associated phospholipid phosphatase
MLVALIAVSLAYWPLNHATTNMHIVYTVADRHISVVAPFALPYLIFIPAYWLTVLWAFITGRSFARLALAGLLVGLVSASMYYAFQTFVPRPHLAGSGWATELVRYIYAHDRPYNDLPSGHASSAVLFALYYVTRESRWRVAALLLAAAVVASTIFIKQHSLAGTLGGIGVAAAAWVVVGRLVAHLPALDAGVDQDDLHDHGQQDPGR